MSRLGASLEELILEERKLVSFKMTQCSFFALMPLI